MGRGPDAAGRLRRLDELVAQRWAAVEEVIRDRDLLRRSIFEPPSLSEVERRRIGASERRHLEAEAPGVGVNASAARNGPCGAQAVGLSRVLPPDTGLSMPRLWERHRRFEQCRDVGAQGVSDESK